MFCRFLIIQLRKEGGNMIKYEIERITREFYWKDRRSIEEGCTIGYEGDIYPDIVASYTDLEKAKADFSKYETTNS